MAWKVLRRLDKDEVAHYVRPHAGETMRQLASSAIDYWTAYGLRPDVLAAICDRVFGLTLS